MTRHKAVFNWSGGKDSAHALWRAMRSERYEIVALLTTVNRSTLRSTMHGIPTELLRAQADRIGIPLHTVDLTPKGDMEDYSAKAFRAGTGRLRGRSGRRSRRCGIRRSRRWGRSRGNQPLRGIAPRQHHFGLRRPGGERLQHFADGQQAAVEGDEHLVEDDHPVLPAGKRFGTPPQPLPGQLRIDRLRLPADETAAAEPLDAHAPPCGVRTVEQPCDLRLVVSHRLDELPDIHVLPGTQGTHGKAEGRGVGRCRRGLLRRRFQRRALLLAAREVLLRERQSRGGGIGVRTSSGIP